MRSCVFKRARVASGSLAGSLVACALAVSFTEAESPHFYSQTDLSLIASSTTEVEDKRIAAYFSKDESTGQEVRSCTAANVAENLWITARHCSPKIGDSIGRSEDEKVAVEEVHLATESDDIAVVKVASVLDAVSFDLPAGSIQEGEELSLVGYGADHDYASAAPVKVVGFVGEYPPELGNPRKDLLTLEFTSQSRACEGDSGGPIFEGNVLYASHSSAATNRGCYDAAPGGLAWATLLTPERVDWIKSLIAEEGN